MQHGPVNILAGKRPDAWFRTCRKSAVVANWWQVVGMVVRLNIPDETLLALS